MIENGFSVNEAKTRLMQRSQRQRVTGLVVNEKLNVSIEYTRSLRNLLYIWKRHGEPAAIEAFSRAIPARTWPPGKPPPNFKLVVRGRVQHVGNVKGWDNPVYLRLADSLATLDESFSPRPSTPPQTIQVKLFTEGRSDLKHLLAAQTYFHKTERFLGIRLEAGSAFGGGPELLKFCEALPKAAESPTLCVFDTDDDSIFKKATKRKGWKIWGSKSAAVALAPPPWLKPSDPVCIELLYEDDVFQRCDSEGRRLFRRSEFDKVTGRHKSTDYTIPNAGNDTLIQETVHDRDGNSIGLGKESFADCIRKAVRPFDDITFEGFQGTFEAIREATEQIRTG